MPPHHHYTTTTITQQVMVAKSMGVTTTSLHPTDGALALDPIAARRAHVNGGGGDRTARGAGAGTGGKIVAPLPCSAYQDIKEEMYMQDVYKCQQRQHQQVSQATTNTNTNTNHDGGQQHTCTKVFSQTTFTLPDKKTRH